MLFTILLSPVQPVEDKVGLTNILEMETHDNEYAMPSGFFDGANKYVLFEGSNAGSGELALTIYQSTNVLAQASAFLDLHDIKDLYERVAVTNVIQSWPAMVETPLTSGVQVVYSPPYDPSEAKELAVFVHGWRMTESDYYSFSETMFKRLYWQGFQGRFASLRWPTRSEDTDPPILGLIPADLLTYNRSEHIALKSGTGAAAYFTGLRERYTNYTISACAHSMGGVVMMESLKQLAAAEQQPLDNLVLMQAAVPAQCYDTTVTNLPLLVATEASFPTPNTYSNYAAAMTNALRRRAYNFHNADDFALATGTKTILGTTYNVSWEGNQSFLLSGAGENFTIKPNAFFGYYSDGTTGYWTNKWNQSSNYTSRVVSSAHELMPFVARSRSKAVGAQPGVGQVINGGEFNLSTQLGFGREDYDHSGQFHRNVQTLQVQGFYNQLLERLFSQTP